MNLNFNRKFIFYLLLTGVTSSILIFLTFNGYWSLTHGPLYFFLGDGIYMNGKLSSTIYVNPENSDVYTFQIGIALFHFLTIFLLNENWFIAYLIVISFVWAYTLNFLDITLGKYNLNNLDRVIISLLIFFQPYNLNQIANFSNESLYFPFLILAFFYSLNLPNKSFKDILNNEKIVFILFLFFLFFGSFFRLHHIIFFSSFIFFYLLIKRFDLFIIFLTLFFSTLALKYFIIVNSDLDGSISTIKSFVETVYEAFISGNVKDHIPSDHFIQKDIFLNSVLNSISNFSFYLFIGKFFDNIYLAIFISSLFALIPLTSILQTIRNNFKSFGLLSLIFLIFSSLFIFLLPMFEYSYLLPTTFLIIIFNFIFFKKILKKYFYKLIFVTIIFVSSFIISVFSGLIKFKNVEIYQYRNYVKGIITLTDAIDKKNSLVYFNEKNPSMPEIYRWYLKSTICNFDFSFEKCARLKKIDEIKKIYIIVTENRESTINTKFLTNLYKIENVVLNEEALQKYFILNEK